jgi:hypothetical protein
MQEFSGLSPDKATFEDLHRFATETVVWMEELASSVSDRSQPVHNGAWVTQLTEITMPAAT